MVSSCGRRLQRYLGIVLFGGILFLPMLVDCVCDLRKPRPVLGLFHHLGGGKKLDAVRRRIAERLEQARSHKNRHVVWLAIQNPRRLLRREPCRQLAASLTVLPTSSRAQVQVAGSLIADLESPDLSSSSASWHNHSSSTDSVGDFSTADFNFVNVTNLSYNFQPVNVLNVSSVGSKSLFSQNNVPVGITGNGSVSVEAWVFPTGSTGDSTAVSYGLQGGSSAPLEQREFNYNDGNNGAVSGFFGGFDTPWANNPVTLNVWHHLVWTYDGTTLNLYMDGVLNNTRNPGVTLVTPQTVMTVGSALNGGGTIGTDPFKGYIASVRVHTGILTSGQVSNNYSAGPAAVASTAALAPLTWSVTGNQINLNWQAGTLQASPSLTGTWTNVGGAVSPFTFTPDPTVPSLFFRLQY
jgi:hypothetical protein